MGQSWWRYFGNGKETKKSKWCYLRGKRYLCRKQQSNLQIPMWLVNITNLIVVWFLINACHPSHSLSHTSVVLCSGLKIICGFVFICFRKFGHLTIRLFFHLDLKSVCCRSWKCITLLSHLIFISKPYDVSLSTSKIKYFLKIIDIFGFVQQVNKFWLCIYNGPYLVYFGAHKPTN